MYIAILKNPTIFMSANIFKHVCLYTWTIWTTSGTYDISIPFLGNSELSYALPESSKQPSSVNVEGIKEQD